MVHGKIYSVVINEYSNTVNASESAYYHCCDIVVLVHVYFDNLLNVNKLTLWDISVHFGANSFMRSYIILFSYISCESFVV